MKTPDNLFVTPDIFPEKIDLPNRKLHCCNMLQSGYRESPFMDHRIVKSNNDVSILDVNELRVIAGRYQCDVTHYVFHNAYCCSTLFSRCLNAYTSSLILREPNVLLEQASIYRYRGTKLLPSIDGAFVDSLMDVVSKLLSRRYQENKIVVIKPSDACNNIMGRMLDMNASNKCLLMYSDIERFLTAIFKNQQRAEWVKIRVNELCIDEVKLHGKLEVDPQSLNHYQLAALVWVLHMKKFRRMIDEYGAARVQVLDSERFMKNQVGSVYKYLRFIGQEVEEAELADGVGEVTQTHSKADKLNYSYEQREAEYQIERNRFLVDIDAAIEWVKEMFGHEAVCGLDENAAA